MPELLASSSSAPSQKPSPRPAFPRIRRLSKSREPLQVRLRRRSRSSSTHLGQHGFRDLLGPLVPIFFLFFLLLCFGLEVVFEFAALALLTLSSCPMPTYVGRRHGMHEAAAVPVAARLTPHECETRNVHLVVPFSSAFGRSSASGLTAALVSSSALIS